MNILINQTSHELPDGATLADALAAVAARPPFAVAANTGLVPNTRYTERVRHAGDRGESNGTETCGRHHRLP